MICPRCSTPVITGFTPGGRLVDLDFDHTWVRSEEPWPGGLFVVAVSGRDEPVVPHVVPAIEAVDRVRNCIRAGHSGPYRREHRCPRGAFARAAEALVGALR